MIECDKPLGQSYCRIAAIMAAFLFLSGCDNYLERRELEREQRQLQTQQAQLEKALMQEIAGKTDLTDQEKARVGPLAIELRKVEIRLADVKTRLHELN